MRSAPWFSTLAPHAARLTDAHLADLVRDDPGRATDLSVRVGPLYANFARQRVDRAAWAALLAVAQARDVSGALAALFDGHPVNRSEQRPALHTALRSDLGAGDTARAAFAEASATRERMAALVAALDASGVTDIVNVGIGGSDLGPRLALDALRDLDRGRFRVHFLSNVDGNAARHVLRGLDPARTAAILVSKSFGTQETLLNGSILRAWLGDGERLYAVSSKPDRALAHGIAPERVLPMWDWVGGRYSLWSAVGFSIALALGMDGFERLLAGAALMDAHVRHTPAEGNLAVLHAMVGIWNRNGLGYGTQAILPYDDRLARLPAYLQQLVMESLGKRVAQEGEPVHTATVPVVWGGAGTDSQHSFFQALHQGTDTVPADFIGVLRSPHGFEDNRRALHANLLAQSEAFANGASDADAQKAYPGDRPSTMLLLDQLDAESFGALLALYEHSVYVQSVVWGINAFDQWGVELGKKIAASLLPAVAGDDVPVDDAVTRVLLQEMRTRG
ncbi:glucose-6-phosphate isomerase [Chiayiivirga flava]|uniref:Glucose-6-phosphate isomerase n=1 Tax=Chiayiivirga flava TaxID=659595 RepID=A0A7W8FYE0_9GAMM|nr:glucose-6-phosphate isomerase [Chiayiivirga flava]MBB5207006.1 glucose-6-phosphate isomerase [Chiayiivirga flava]